MCQAKINEQGSDKLHFCGLHSPMGKIDIEPFKSGVHHALQKCPGVNPVLSLDSCVTFGKWLNHSMPDSSYIKWEIIIAHTS